MEAEMDGETLVQISGCKEASVYYINRWKKLQENLHQNVEVWVDSVREFTFRTWTVDLAYSEADAMVQHYQHTYNHRAALTPQQEEAMISLTKKLEDAIAPIIQQGGEGAFVRLSSRSPKDAVLMPGEATDRMMKVLTDDLKQEGHFVSHNREFCALMKVGTESLKVRNAKQALDLLLNSERVFIDLMLALDFPKVYSMKLIIREWEHLDYHMEFRGFVHNNSLNALCQYDSFCYFEELQDPQMQEMIVSRVQELFEVVKKDIPFENYVIDFGVMPDKVIIVELNSWNSGTGSAMFSWVSDISVLENGPFEFRVNKAPTPDSIFQSHVAPEWMDLIKRARPYALPADDTTHVTPSAASRMSWCILL